MYIPILKNRRAEMGAMKVLKNGLSETIVPMFEIISVDNKGLEETIEGLKKIVNGEMFVDLFRFDISKYSQKIDATKCPFSILVNDNSKYKEYLLELGNYQNVIPVISIKEGFNFDVTEISDLIKTLKELKNSIAVRITDDKLDTYINLIEKELRKSDYFIFDIGEQDISSKFMEILKINNSNIDAKRIVVASSRSSDNETCDFYDGEKTPLIDNSLLFQYEEYNFEGYGDYANIKDLLPSPGGGGGYGRAYALLFNYQDEGVYSFVNDNTTDGVKGYRKIVPRILSKKDFFDKDNTCPAIAIIQEMMDIDRFGNWEKWIKINIIRHISQINKYKETKV